MKTGLLSHCLCVLLAAHGLNAGENKAIGSVLPLGLPLAFNLTEESAEGETTYRYRSVEPISKNGLYGRFFLKISTFDSHQQAQLAFQETWDRTNENTGLTYGWDTVFVNGTQLYWLHSECTLSKQNIEGIRQNLDKFLDSRLTKLISPHLNCHCGGGCRLSADAANTNGRVA